MRFHSRPPAVRDRGPRILGILVLLAGLVLASCVPLEQYHTGSTPRECGDRPQGDCLTTYVEKHEEYMLGFVEFDDLGWAWDREQGRVLFREIRRHKGDVLMVLFTHGWKHNADPCDSNVTCFRETLRGLHAAETALYGDDARRIVGIYVGWRGDSTRGGPLRQVSFFGRKSTAHKVGSGALTELIVRLKEERAMRGGDSRLVIVGHSFGGAAVYSATSQLIMDRLATAAERGGAVRGLGDLVVLVNPAFEASLYQPLFDTLNEKTVGSDPNEPDRHATYPPEQAPVLAIFTSKGDTATGKWFPRGRFLAAKKDKTRSSLQKRANRAAVGHFEEFRTHSLTPKAAAVKLAKVEDRSTKECGCPYGSASQRSMGSPDEIRAALGRLRDLRYEGARTAEYGNVVLRQERGPDHSPILVASVDDSIIKGHNDIYRPVFIDFLRLFIMLSAEQGRGEPASKDAGP